MAKRNTANINKQTECLHCGKTFLHARGTAKFCDDTCRKAYNYKQRKERAKAALEQQERHEQQMKKDRKGKENLLHVVTDVHRILKSI